MSVVSVTEDGKGRSAEFHRDWTRKYKRVFLVQTNSPHDGPLTVANGISSTVAIGNSYSNATPTSGATESDSLVYCESLLPECVTEDFMGWKVTASYTTYNPAEKPESPLDAVPEVNWDHAPYEEICDQDTSGNAILNSAGDPFDPGVTRDSSRPVLRISLNKASYDPTEADAYRDAVNTDTFFGAPAGNVKCAQYAGSLKYWPNYGYYWQINFEFHFNPLGFQKQILDQGLRQVVSGKRLAIKGDDGRPVSSPVPLNGSGGVLASGGTPSYLNFNTYKTAAFSGLGLENSTTDSDG